MVLLGSNGEAAVSAAHAFVPSASSVCSPRTSPAIYTANEWGTERTSSSQERADAFNMIQISRNTEATG